MLDSYAYGYDADGRRTSVQRTDNSTVNYGYDDLGELTRATGYETSGTPRANENFGYGYDSAGNLLLRTNNTLIQELTLDNANEVVNIQRDNNLLTVAGSLNGPVKSLSVNGQAAAVYGDTTYAVPAGVAVTNGLNMLAAVVNGTLTNQVGEFLPVGVHLQYDLNGNLISDGQRTYAYDCANELILVTTTNVSIAGSTTTTNSYLTKYAYDGFGRRRAGQEYQWGPITAQPGTACCWVAVNAVRYIYDGMTVLQERDGNNNLLVDYTRGLDLSGTLQGAGGAGGLLARTDNSGNSAYYHADGNGNVTMLVDSMGNVLAKYLYDSFGNTLGMWGPLAQTNTYRFSSKEIDLTSGLYYYGYRYYQPNLQRWLNRDPLQEIGFELRRLYPPSRIKNVAFVKRYLASNLFQFDLNNPITEFDPLGLVETYSCDDLAVAAYAAWNSGDVWAYQVINQMMDDLGCFDPPPRPAPAPNTCPELTPPSPGPLQNNLGITPLPIPYSQPTVNGPIAFYPPYTGTEILGLTGIGVITIIVIWPVFAPK